MRYKKKGPIAWAFVRFIGRGERIRTSDPSVPNRRNGLAGLEQRIEINSPLALVILMLVTNDFQSVHTCDVWHSAQGVGTLVDAVRRAPIEPGLPVPKVLVVSESPPPIQEPMATIAPKFRGAKEKSAGLAAALESVARERGCEFFDSGSVTGSSVVDGVHLDADQYLVLGRAIARTIAPLLADR